MKNKIVTKVFAVAAAAMMTVSNPILANAQTPVTKDNFDATRYADDYADLKAAFGSNKDALWSHYVNNGAAEGRVVYTTTGDVGTFMSVDNFDYTRYANDYADLKAAFGYNKDALWNHYTTYGVNEGRKAYTTKGAATTPAGGVNAGNFDYTRYANDYADLKAAFGYNKDALWNHYTTLGVNEGRKAYTANGAPAATTAQASVKDLALVRRLFGEVLAEYKDAYARGDSGAWENSIMRFSEKLLANGFTRSELRFLRSDVIGSMFDVLINDVWYEATPPVHMRDLENYGEYQILPRTDESLEFMKNHIPGLIISHD